MVFARASEESKRVAFLRSKRIEAASAAHWVPLERNSDAASDEQTAKTSAKCASALRLLWICFASALHLHWICFGFALDLRWICFASPLSTIKMHCYTETHFADQLHWWSRLLDRQSYRQSGVLGWPMRRYVRLLQSARILRRSLSRFRGEIRICPLSASNTFLVWMLAH